MQPRGEGRFASKQAELLPRADEDVLRQFLGRVGTGHPAGQIEDPRQMRPVDPLESRRIPLRGKDDVVHWHLIGWWGGGKGWKPGKTESGQLSGRFVFGISTRSYLYPVFPYGLGREKSTFGACLAASGALNSSYSLKPKMPAVMLLGNERRLVL